MAELVAVCVEDQIGQVHRILPRLRSVSLLNSCLVAKFYARVWMAASVQPTPRPSHGQSARRLWLIFPKCFPPNLHFGRRHPASTEPLTRLQRGGGHAHDARP